MTGQAIVYRAFDADGSLLYVGMTTKSIKDRLEGHRSASAWWPRFDRCTVENFDSRAAAAIGERRAIQLEQPEFNVYWNRSRKVHPLRRLREARLMSAAELATAIGCTSRSVNNWESGRGAPRMFLGFRMADALGVSVGEIAECFPVRDRESVST